MVSQNIDLEDVLGKRHNWKLIKRVHDKIVSRNHDVLFRIFPIYIKYICNDSVIAVLYFKASSPQSKGSQGITLESDEIDLGLNPKSNDKSLNLRDASYMKDRNINRSIKLKSDSTDKVVEKIVQLIQV